MWILVCSSEDCLGWGGEQWQGPTSKHLAKFHLEKILVLIISMATKWFRFQTLLQLPYLYALCLLSHSSRVQLLATLWTVAHQAPLSLGFSRQEYWSRLPCPPPWDLPNKRTEPTSPPSPDLQAGSLPIEPPGKRYQLCPNRTYFLILESFLSPATSKASVYTFLSVSQTSYFTSVILLCSWVHSLGSCNRQYLWITSIIFPPNWCFWLLSYHTSFFT